MRQPFGIFSFGLIVHFLQNPLKCVLNAKTLIDFLRSRTLTEYMTEQEQIQELKKWLKQYGPTIILGIGLALIVNYGWRYWQNYNNKILTHASNVYDEMLIQRAESNTEGTLVQAKKIISHYPKTPYAAMAAFMLARDAAQKKNYPETITQLNWVIAHSDDKAIREIARLRIARTLIADKKPKEAIESLNNSDDKNFNGLINEIRGDAYLALNDQAAARKAYSAALQELPNAEVSRPLLQMKLDNLAT